jgi:hypothetical protein
MKNNRVFWEALLQVLTRVRLFFSILYERALPVSVLPIFLKAAAEGNHAGSTGELPMLPLPIGPLMVKPATIAEAASGLGL